MFLVYYSFRLLNVVHCISFPEAGKRISQRVYVVYGGLEPMSFKVAFPWWTDKPYITSIQKEVQYMFLRHILHEFF